MNLIGKDHRFFFAAVVLLLFLPPREERKACVRGNFIASCFSFISCAMFCRCLSLSLCLTLCVSVFMRCVTLHACIANGVVEDSYCRGGIVNTWCGCSYARSVRPKSPTALWRFRVSTSNSPSDRTWLPNYTPIRYIDHTYAQQDIRVCGGDHFEPPEWQHPNPKALWLLRVSI